MHYPVDPNSRNRHIKKLAMPSEVNWEEANVRWENSDFTWESTKGSAHWREILKIVGSQNRRDALHVDSAYKTGCFCLVTRDSDILKVRKQLHTLLNLNIFSPEENELFALLETGEKQ